MKSKLLIRIIKRESVPLYLWMSGPLPFKYYIKCRFDFVIGYDDNVALRNDHHPRPSVCLPADGQQYVDRFKPVSL